MAIYARKFVDGKVVIEGAPPPDGTEAEVYVIEDGEVQVTPEMEADLAAAIERLDRGEFVTWEEVQVRLRSIEQGTSDAQI